MAMYALIEYIVVMYPVMNTAFNIFLHIDSKMLSIYICTQN